MCGVVDASLFACLDALCDPGDVARERAHRLQPFEILADFVRREAVYLVPVPRADDDHVGHLEVLVQAVKGCRRAATAARRQPLTA